MSKFPQHRDTLTALGALNAITPAIGVSDYENVSFSLTGLDTSVCTVTVLGSLNKEAPTFSSAATLDNEYQTIVCQGYEDDAAVEGDTGIPFAANGVKLFSASVSGLDWIAFKVTAYTSGNVTPKVSLHSN